LNSPNGELLTRKILFSKLCQDGRYMTWMHEKHKNIRVKVYVMHQSPNNCAGRSYDDAFVGETADIDKNIHYCLPNMRDKHCAIIIQHNPSKSNLSQFALKANGFLR
jgi:hypothetical protein